MSSYHSRMRWQAHGVRTRREARERAPGFGRDRWNPEPVPSRTLRDVLDEFHRIHGMLIGSSGSNNGNNNKENKSGADNLRVISPQDYQFPKKPGQQTPIELQSLYLRDVLRLGDGMTIRSASVEAVLEWASQISGLDLSTRLEFTLLREDFSVDEEEGEEELLIEAPSASSALDAIPEETFEYEDEEEDEDEEDKDRYECYEEEKLMKPDSITADNSSVSSGGLSMLRDDSLKDDSLKDDSLTNEEAVPEELVPEETAETETARVLESVSEKIRVGKEEDFWEKLKILLSAAILARDDDDDEDDDDSHELYRLDILNNDIQFAVEDSASESEYTSSSMGVDAGANARKGVVTRRRKMLILYAAFFDLCPKEIFSHAYTTEEHLIGSSAEDRDQGESSRYVRIRRLFERAMRLCPSRHLGLTPLAIAAAASASIFPSSFMLSTGDGRQEEHRSYAFDADGRADLLTLSRRIIDRILDLNPDAATVRSRKDQLPLHLAVHSGKAWEDGVGSIFEAYPEALSLADARGWLPLHVAAASHKTLPSVLTKLVKIRPQAARVRDREGRLPLHLAAEHGKTWTTGVEDIFAAYPEAAVMPDSKGRLPAYYRVCTNTVLECNARNHKSNRFDDKSFATTTLVKALLQNLVKSKAKEEDRGNAKTTGSILGISPPKVIPGFTSSGFYFDAPQLPSYSFRSSKQKDERDEKEERNARELLINDLKKSMSSRICV